MAALPEADEPAARTPAAPIDYAVGASTWLPKAWRTLYGVAIPVAGFIVGYWLVVQTTAGKGDIGFAGAFLWLLVLPVTGLVTAVNMWLAGFQCRSWQFALGRGLVVPLIVLIAVYVLLWGPLTW